VTDRDLDQWIELWNAIQFEQRDRASLAFEDGMRPAGEPWLRLGAWAGEGSLAGIAELVVTRWGMREPDTAMAAVVVAPAWRRRGLGGELLARVEAFARTQGHRYMTVHTLDRDLPTSWPFLTRQGFSELERRQYSVQDPRTVDVFGLEDLRRQLAQAGIETTAFSGIDSPANREELWRTSCAIDHDVPTVDHWTDPSLEDFNRGWFDAPTALAEAIFVARDGEHIVGLTGLERRPPDDAEVTVTGVLEPYRRRGIARVLKLMATRYAQTAGFARVYTENNFTNPGMLAINWALGFRPAPVLIVARKELRPKAST